MSTTEHEPRRRIGRNPNRQNIEISVDKLVELNTVSNDAQVELEREKQAVAKVQRLHERTLKQLEEVSASVATSEAEYRTKERIFKDKEGVLEAELQKIRSDVERQKQEFKDQLSKVTSKIEYKENVLDAKLKDKNREYQLKVKALQIDLEEAQKKIKDNSKIKELESAIRKVRDETTLMANNNRKLETQLAVLQGDITHERETITELQEQIEETEKSNTQLSGITEIREKLSEELKQLNKKINETEKELDSNKDNNEKIMEAKSNLRALKNKNDDLVHERDRLEQNLTRIKAGLNPLAEGERDSGNVSRLANVSKESAYEKYGRAGRDRTDDARKVADAKQAREDEKKIRDLKTAVKNLKREKDREIETYNKKLATAESNVTKAQVALTKIEQDKKGMQKLLKQEKEFIVANMATIKDKIQYYTARKEIYETELKKTKKALQDSDFQLGELKRQVSDAQKLLNDKTKIFADVELDKTQRLRTMERSDKDLANELKNLNTLTEKLNDTQLSLLSFRQQVLSTQEEFKVTKEDMLLDVHTLEAEIYDQTVENETTERVKAELRQELASLKWYFQPLKEKSDVDTQLYSTIDFDFITERKRKRDAEMQAIKEEIQNTSLEYIQKSKEGEDFKKDLDKALQAMAPEDRGDLLFEMKDLMEAMRLALFKQRTILQIVSLLAEHQVYPGAVRELSLLVKGIREQHAMQRPDILLKVIFRDYKRDPAAKSFRRRLLEKLVFMRMKKTNKSYDACEDFIFSPDGEEREEEPEEKK